MLLFVFQVQQIQQKLMFEKIQKSTEYVKQAVLENNNNKYSNKLENNNTDENQL